MLPRVEGEYIIRLDGLRFKEDMLSDRRRNCNQIKGIYSSYLRVYVPMLKGIHPHSSA